MLLKSIIKKENDVKVTFTNGEYKEVFKNEIYKNVNFSDFLDILFMSADFMHNIEKLKYDYDKNNLILKFEVKKNMTLKEIKTIIKDNMREYLIVLNINTLDIYEFFYIIHNFKVTDVFNWNSKNSKKFINLQKKLISNYYSNDNKVFDINNIDYNYLYDVLMSILENEFYYFFNEYKKEYIDYSVF